MGGERVRHRNHLTQRDLTLHLLSLGWDLDLDMIAFFLATLVSLEEGGKVTEEQRRWWRLVLVTPEKNSHHGNQLSASPVEEVEEEATKGIGENKTVEQEQIVDEVEKNDTVEEETIEGIRENQTVDRNDTMKGDVSVLSFNTMESEEKRPN